ncbi:MAG: hypothetical protein AB1498_13395 [bacterium]
MKKILMIIIFVLFIIVGLIFRNGYCMGTKNYGEVRLINKADKEIVSGTIEVCRQKFTFKNIKPNDSIMFSFKIKSDSGYIVSIEFISGKQLKEKIGYVCRGFSFKDSLIIKSDDVILESEVLKEIKEQ